MQTKVSKVVCTYIMHFLSYVSECHNQIINSLPYYFRHSLVFRHLPMLDRRWLPNRVMRSKALPLLNPVLLLPTLWYRDRPSSPLLLLLSNSSNNSNRQLSTNSRLQLPWLQLPMVNHNRQLYMEHNKASRVLSLLVARPHCLQPNNSSNNSTSNSFS